MENKSQNTLRSLSHVMSKLQENGYTANFGVVNDVLMNYDTKKTYTQQETQLDYEFRTEGDTNPEDESILFALSTNDQVKGIIVADYSATSDPSVVQWINEVDKNDNQDPMMI